jgi:hypothetical protein
MIADLARLLGVVALLLSFAILAGRRVQLTGYLGQCAVLALVALCQAWLQADWGLLAVPVVLVVQAAWLRRDRPAFSQPASSPVAMLCASLVFVIVAMATAPSDGLAVPFAMMLLGLFGAATLQGPYGVLLLLNAVVLAMTGAPGLPLRSVTVLALAVLAALVARNGAPMAWLRR